MAVVEKLQGEGGGVTTLFKRGRFFTGEADTVPEEDQFRNTCMLVKDDLIVHVGQENDAPIQKARQAGATEVDLNMQLVVPGFIDSHCHISGLGSALGKLDLRYCKNLEEIRAMIKDYARANPSLSLVLCRGWIQDTTDGIALASMLDDLDPRPILIDANDLHSTWCNTAALEAMGVESMPDPLGGEIQRDKAGKASGLMLETAALQIVWPYLARHMSQTEKIEAILRAMEAYASSGYTGLIDMAMEEADWQTLQQMRSQGKLRCRIAAHWLIMPTGTTEGNLAQVERAIEMHTQLNVQNSPDLRIQGIKLICDGVVDSCTASLCEPYSTNGSNCDPIWTAEMLAPVVERADAAGLQCAFHAIGDNTVKTVIDTIEKHATPGRRHRIEHLEVTRPEDAKRLGQLGITASVQPVHCDPGVLPGWRKALGESRCQRGFAYKEFVDGGAPLAIGTDAPTAPFSAMENLYIATTRRSAKDPLSTATTNAHFALPIATALSAATKGAAYSCFAETWSGQLKAGYKADFAVVDAQWRPETLLQARVVQTWFNGGKVFDALEYGNGLTN